MNMTTNDKRMEINEVSNNISPVIYDNRENLLFKLDEVVTHLHNKALHGSVTNPESDKVKIQWFKVLAYTCSIYSQIKRDVDLDQLNEKIENMNNEIKKLNEAR